MSTKAPTLQELRARLVEVEAANAELAALLEAGRAPARVRHPLRASVAAVLIVLGVLLAPVAIIGGWSRAVLTDTSAFVATYAPLAHDPRVQDYVTDQVVAAIQQNVDIDAIVGDLFDGIAGAVPNRPAAIAALQALRVPTVQGVNATIRQAAAKVVSSQAFAGIWEQSLRISHTQATSALSGDPSSMATITQDGLGIRIGPIIQQVRDALVNQGFTLASRIPAIDKTIVLVRSENLASAMIAYQATIAIGAWLPLLALALIVAGVLVASRRHRAALWASIGVAVGATLILASIAVGRTLAAFAVPPSLMPTDVLQLLYDTVAEQIADIAMVTLTVAVVAGVIIWLTGPFHRAVQLRALSTRGLASVHTWADAHSLSTGRVGHWLHAQRRWLQAGVAVLAGALLIANRPISIPEVLATATTALVALLVLALLQRAPGTEPLEPDVSGPGGTVRPVPHDDEVSTPPTRRPETRAPTGP
jgi:hypothetical protein